MPKEIYKTLMPGEAEPKVKRRIGTSFTLSEDVFKKAIDTVHFYLRNQILYFACY